MWTDRVFSVFNRIQSGFLLHFSIPSLTVLDDFSVFLQVNANCI